MRNNRGLDDSQRLSIIEEHLLGASKYSLVKKYKLCNSQIILKWMRIFGVEPPQKEMVMNKSAETESLLKELEAAKRENKLLKARLKRAEMAEQAWSLMIEVAEERWHIPIRKKPGTK